MKELDDMAKDTSSGMHATPLDPGNMMHLQGRFKGPPGTPYEGGEFVIDIRLPDNYPFMPPKMKFETKVWHPNVSSQTVSVFPSPLYLSFYIYPPSRVRQVLGPARVVGKGAHCGWMPSS